MSEECECGWVARDFSVSMPVTVKTTNTIDDSMVRDSGWSAGGDIGRTWVGDSPYNYPSTIPIPGAVPSTDPYANQWVAPHTSPLPFRVYDTKEWEDLLKTIEPKQIDTRRNVYTDNMGNYYVDIPVLGYTMGQIDVSIEDSRVIVTLKGDEDEDDDDLIGDEFTMIEHGIKTSDDKIEVNIDTTKYDISKMSASKKSTGILTIRVPPVKSVKSRVEITEEE
jgi:HSP20 family molecular chaperone IbpA